jgi:uncharacterized membrane-anchored protein
LTASMFNDINTKTNVSLFSHFSSFGKNTIPFMSLTQI